MKPKVTSQSIGIRHPHRALLNRTRPLQGLDHLATTTSYFRGQEICGQSRPADNWYLLVAGSARRYVARPDGRRQIVDLLLPGDFFGCTALDEYDSAVEAISVDTTVTSYPRRRVEALADSEPRLAREIRMLVLEAMSRLQSQLLIVGRVKAPEKVGSFLLDMAGRLSPGHPDNVILPVSRYDIADYLAVSVETVSRSLTDLKHRGVIAVSGTRSVRIVDRDALDDREASRAHDAPGRSNSNIAWRHPLAA
jgi:CRP/FNR family nitrogen fixation transcriptional regulator